MGYIIGTHQRMGERNSGYASSIGPMTASARALRAAAYPTKLLYGIMETNYHYTTLESAGPFPDRH